MILVVIPAFNEENNIGRVIRGLFEHGFNNIVVVDDGSSDNTALVAEKEGAKAIKHIINRGQGAALETGDEYARHLSADIVVHFDADDQFDPADIKPALEKMQVLNIDVVLGSRFLDNRSKVPWLKKYFILPSARIINRFFCGLKLSDAHNGFRIFNKKALESIHIRQDGMAHNSEIVKIIAEKKLKFAEVSIRVIYREYGQGFLSGLYILKDLLFSKIIK